MKRKILNLSLLIGIIIVVTLLLFITKTTNQLGERVLAKKPRLIREQKIEEVSLVKDESKSKDSEERYVEGEILVKFKDTVTQDEIEKFITDYHLEKLDIIKNLNVYKFKLPEGITVKEILEKLKQDVRLEYAEPNYIFKLQ